MRSGLGTRVEDEVDERSVAWLRVGGRCASASILCFVNSKGRTENRKQRIQCNFFQTCTASFQVGERTER